MTAIPADRLPPAPALQPRSDQQYYFVTSIFYAFTCTGVNIV